MLEALPAPLVRGLGPVLGMVCGELHRDHGVDLRLGVGVAAIEGDGKVERVRLDDGSTVDADVVVVGVGVAPVTDWLEGSGLVLDNGDRVRRDAARGARHRRRRRRGALAEPDVRR